MRLPWAVVMLAVALPACPKSEVEELIARARPLVEANAASAKALAALAASAPATTIDRVTLDAGPLKLSRPLDAEANDTAIMEQLEVLQGHLARYEAGGAGHLAWCTKLLGKNISPSKSVAESSLGACANAKYLLLVRTLKFTEPVVNETEHTFKPGSVSGDVLVYNLAGKKALGGFRFEARSDSTARSFDGRDYAAVKGDLEGHMSKAIREGVTKHLAGP